MLFMGCWSIITIAIAKIEINIIILLLFTVVHMLISFAILLRLFSFFLFYGSRRSWFALDYKRLSNWLWYILLFIVPVS